MILALLLIHSIGYLLSGFIKNKPRGIICCGLLGYSGTQVADKTKMRWLAALNESRGRSSTGIYSLKGDRKHTEYLEKDTLMATKFILTEEFNKAIEGAVMVIGHTRAATVGAVTIENAHPFDYDFGIRTIGAHNGFVADIFLKKYLKDFDLEDEFNVNTMCDSQIIFAMLSKYNGDFHKLSELEGGINCLFSFPDKDPGVLFAYKRAARDLHYGQSPEGIYISSEDEPLEQIGCFNITSLDDNAITIFKNGAVLDIQPIKPPKLHLPIGTTMTNWQGKLSYNEKNQYAETRNLPAASHYKQGRIWDSKTGRYIDDPDVDNQCSLYPSMISDPRYHSTKKAEQGDVDDKFKMLIADAIKEIGYIGSSTPLECQELLDYELEDLTDCLVVVSLKDSVNSEPLPGWCIIDREDPLNIAGITGPNGITILKYPYARVNLAPPRILEMYDPVDGKSVYTLEVKPKQARIMEVVLEIPFPQEKNKAKNNENSELLRGTHERNAAIGANQNGKNIPDNAEQTTVQQTPGANSIGIQGKEKSIYLRDKGQKIVGVSGFKSAKESYDARIERLRRERNLPYTSLWVKEQLALLAQIKKEDKYAEYEVAAVAVQTTVPYKQLQGALSWAIGKLIDLDDLLLDCRLLHVHANRRHKWTYGVSYYAVMLLTEAIDDYFLPEFVISTGPLGILDVDYKHVDDFITIFAADLDERMIKARNEDPKDKPVMKIVKSLSEISREEASVNTEKLNDLMDEHSMYH